MVTYLDRKYVVELKIWRGPKAHENGIKQLEDYLERAGTKKGYLVIYDLRKDAQKEWRQETIAGDGKGIFAIWV